MILEQTFLALVKKCFDSCHCTIELKSWRVSQLQSTGQREASLYLFEDDMSSASELKTKFLKHQFYLVPDLNEPLILGIHFIQKYQLWYCPKIRSFACESQPNWGQATLKSAMPLSFHLFL